MQTAVLLQAARVVTRKCLLLCYGVIQTLEFSLRAGYPLCSWCAFRIYCAVGSCHCYWCLGKRHAKLRAQLHSLCCTSASQLHAECCIIAALLNAYSIPFWAGDLGSKVLVVLPLPMAAALSKLFVLISGVVAVQQTQHSDSVVADLR